jgi:hypothetical protein
VIETTGINEKENYDLTKPDWFNNAPYRAKEYRKTIEEKKDIKLMRYLKKVISYNVDGTINILPLRIMFRDFSWSTENKMFDHDEASELLKSNWYRLLFAHEDKDDAPQKMSRRDFYRTELTSIFNPYGKQTFRGISGCSYYPYWTATRSSFSFKARNLDTGYADEVSIFSGERGWVCGIRDMN